MPTCAMGRMQVQRTGSALHQLLFGPHQKGTYLLPASPLEVMMRLGGNACRFGLKGGCSALLLSGGAWGCSGCKQGLGLAVMVPRACLNVPRHAA